MLGSAVGGDHLNETVDLQVLVAVNGIDCFTIAVKFTSCGSLEHVSVIRTDHGITCPKVRLWEAVSISCSSFSSCIGIMLRNDLSKVALISLESMSTNTSTCSILGPLLRFDIPIRINEVSPGLRITEGVPFCFTCSSGVSNVIYEFGT